MDHKKVSLVCVAVGIGYAVFYEKVLAFTTLPVNYGVAALLALASYFVYDRLVTKEQAEAKIMEYKQNIYPHIPGQENIYSHIPPAQNPEPHIPTYTNTYPGGFQPSNIYPHIPPQPPPAPSVINPQQFTPATNPPPPQQPVVDEKIDWKTKIQSYKR